MREILFRGKRIDNGEWVEGDLIQLHDGRKYIVNNRFGACIDDKGNFINTEEPFVCQVDPATVGQYTGLTDKNGRRIFEGDILKEDYRYRGKHVLHLVGFGESSFGTKRFVSGKLSDIFIPFDDCENPMCAERETEVIGNVHDNPELLKEGQR